MRANCANRPWGGPRRSQDRLGSVLFSSCRSGSLFWSSWAPLGVVFGRLGLLLGSFWAAPGVVLVLFRHFNSSIQPINSSTHRFNSSTHQLIDSTHQPINSIPKVDDVSSCLWLRCVRCCFVLVFVVLCSLTCLLIYSSTHQPMALRHFLTRPGGLRAARLNPPPPEGSERV